MVEEVDEQAYENSSVNFTWLLMILLCLHPLLAACCTVRMSRPRGRPGTQRP